VSAHILSELWQEKRNFPLFERHEPLSFFSGALAAIFGVVLFASTFDKNMQMGVIPVWLRETKDAVLLTQVIIRFVGVWFFILGVVLALIGLTHS
jgi:hypothetical protein